MEISDYLLDKNLLIDIIHSFLLTYMENPDEDARDCSYIVACIICNLTLSRNKQGASLLLHHPIWKFIIETCLSTNSAFFPMIAVF
jgi:hypothetical protein